MINNIIKTKRFVLREFSVEDAKEFYNMNLDAEVMKHTGDVPFQSVEEAEEFIINYDHYQKYGYGRWTIIEKGSENYIGWCGLKMTESLNEIDLGFRIKKEYWNKGIATETAKAVLDFALTKLEITKVVARAMKDNTVSIKVIKKLGMKFRNEFVDEKGKWQVYEISK